MSTALFQPIRVGNLVLQHRVVLAPMTRMRATAAHVPTDMMVEYYAQRASVRGTLLISEGTPVAPEAGEIPFTPGIWNTEQIEGWKKIVDAVHDEGSFIFLQIAALGRTARSPLLKKVDPTFRKLAPSPIPLSEDPEDVPEEMSKDDIKHIVQQFVKASENAVDGAGFDGVEIHGANGFLVDQFLQDVSNKRTDEYGGSIENRARFVLEVVGAIAEKIGQKKVAIRLSPWCKNQDMRMEDPVPTYTYLVEQLKARFPDLAYVHVLTPLATVSVGPEDPATVDFIHKIWAPRPLVTSGKYTREMGIKVAEETGQLIGYGEAFLANPDLPFRLREDIKLNPADLSTFYTAGSAEGYTTYPFSEEFLKGESGSA